MTEIRTTSSTGGQKGTKLARFDLIPAGPLKELAEHYGRGARKYANHQWRQGYEWSKSIAALGRHFNDFMAGKDYDVCSNDPGGCSFVTAEGEPYEPTEPDTCFNHTGSHHMAAVAWHSFLLLEFKDTYPQHDDRYRPTPAEVLETLLDIAEADEVEYAVGPIHPETGTTSDIPSGEGDLTHEVDTRILGEIYAPAIRELDQVINALSDLAQRPPTTVYTVHVNGDIDTPTINEALQRSFDRYARHTF